MNKAPEASAAGCGGLEFIVLCGLLGSLIGNVITCKNRIEEVTAEVRALREEIKARQPTEAP